MSVDPSVAMRWVTMETSRKDVLTPLVAVTLTSRPEVAFPSVSQGKESQFLGFDIPATKLSSNVVKNYNKKEKKKR